MLSTSPMKLKLSCLILALAFPSVPGVAQAAKPEDLEQLMHNKQCNGCDLSQADLSNQDLSGAQLVGANLNGANLVNTDLSGANLTKASVVGANLAEVNLNQTILTETTFVYSNLARAKIRGARILNTDFQGANLAGVDFSQAQVRKSSFAGANIYSTAIPRSVQSNTTANSRPSTMPGSTINGILGLDGEDQTPLDITIDPVDSTLESGVTYRRRPRSFKVPAYIGTVQRSSVAGDKFHKELATRFD
jgi:Pentapeptide repeats (8 copies)